MAKVELRIDGGIGARTTQLRHQHPAYVWKYKYQPSDKSKTKSYYENRPFLAVPIRNSGGSVLGVIRVADAAEDKERFADNDLAILAACAVELGSSLEANSIGYFLQNISDGVKDLTTEVTSLGAKSNMVNSELANLQRSIDRASRQKIVVRLSTLIPCFVAGVTGATLPAGVVFFLLYNQWYLRVVPIAIFLTAFLLTWFCWKRTDR